MSIPIEEVDTFSLTGGWGSSGASWPPDDVIKHLPAYVLEMQSAINERRDVLAKIHPTIGLGVTTRNIRTNISTLNVISQDGMPLSIIPHNLPNPLYITGEASMHTPEGIQEQYRYFFNAIPLSEQSKDYSVVETIKTTETITTTKKTIVTVFNKLTGSVTIKSPIVTKKKVTNTSTITYSYSYTIIALLAVSASLVSEPTLSASVTSSFTVSHTTDIIKEPDSYSVVDNLNNIIRTKVETSLIVSTTYTVKKVSKQSEAFHQLYSNDYFTGHSTKLPAGSVGFRSLWSYLSDSLLFLKTLISASVFLRKTVDDLEFSGHYFDDGDISAPSAINQIHNIADINIGVDATRFQSFNKDTDYWEIVKSAKVIPYFLKDSKTINTRILCLNYISSGTYVHFDKGKIFDTTVYSSGTLNIPEHRDPNIIKQLKQLNKYLQAFVNITDMLYNINNSVFVFKHKRDGKEVVMYNAVIDNTDSDSLVKLTLVKKALILNPTDPHLLKRTSSLEYLDTVSNYYPQRAINPHRAFNKQGLDTLYSFSFSTRELTKDLVMPLYSLNYYTSNMKLGAINIPATAQVIHGSIFSIMPEAPITRSDIDGRVVYNSSKTFGNMYVNSYYKHTVQEYTELGYPRNTHIYSSYTLSSGYSVFVSNIGTFDNKIKYGDFVLDEPKRNLYSSSTSYFDTGSAFAYVLFGTGPTTLFISYSFLYQLDESVRNNIPCVYGYNEFEVAYVGLYSGIISYNPDPSNRSFQNYHRNITKAIYDKQLQSSYIFRPYFGVDGKYRLQLYGEITNGVLDLGRIPQKDRSFFDFNNSVTVPYVMLPSITGYDVTSNTNVLKLLMSNNLVEDYDVCTFSPHSYFSFHGNLQKTEKFLRRYSNSDVGVFFDYPGSARISMSYSIKYRSANYKIFYLNFKESGRLKYV